MKINIGDPSNANMEGIIKLTMAITAGNITLDSLYENGIIPKNPCK